MSYTDLEEYASSATGYICKYVDNVVITKMTPPNQRPWLDAKSLFPAQNLGWGQPFQLHQEN